MGALRSAALAPYLERATGFPFLDVAEEEPDPVLVATVPENIAVGRFALPMRECDGHVLVAMADPLDIATIDDLKVRLRKPIRPCLSLRPDLQEAIRRAYDARLRARSVLEEMGKGNQVVTDAAAENLTEHLNDAPTVRLVNSIMAGAFANEASDVHLEPRPDGVHVRYRIDGLLYDQMSIPVGHLASTVSRLKIMAGLDIAEKRRPQDGRFSAREESGREFDVRLSVVPTVHGQKACLRLLAQTDAVPSLTDLGLLPEQRALFERMLRRPHGLILVTGPTGSGKSTSLYAGLEYVQEPTLNINTIEDPVEYALPWANQVQVNPKIGLTFASGLRALLRQDPDIILIGEIRDRETAEIAIQAAMTGHLVLSTLHTNDAGSALVRLQHMGIEPYLVSSAVIGVVGQRLLRRLCLHCREPYTPTRELANAVGLPVVGDRLPELSRGQGCRRCGGRGMRGRTAAFEVMPITDRVRELVLRGASGSELAAQATEEQRLSMREAAVQKVLDHVTTPEEVLRVFAQGE